MNTVLYFSIRGVVYETRAYTNSDIAELVDEPGLQCLTSSDRQFDFWFAPSVRGGQRRVNRAATELLLATTNFTAKSAPLLRGCVVAATHDADGDLDGLSWQQLDLLVERSRAMSARDERILRRRIAREDRRTRRATRAARDAASAVSEIRDVARVARH